MNTPGERLRAERTRLGLSQEAFAAHGGVKKLAQINYERDKRKPDAKYLEGIAAAGADVAFIVTGETAEVRARLDVLKGSTEDALKIPGTPEQQAALRNADVMRKFDAISTRETPLSDRARLAAAVVAVEEGLAELKRKLPPRKRAELILAAYDLMAEPEQTRDNVIRLVRAAA